MVDCVRGAKQREREREERRETRERERAAMPSSRLLRYAEEDVCSLRREAQAHENEKKNQENDLLACNFTHVSLHPQHDLSSSNEGASYWNSCSQASSSSSSSSSSAAAAAVVASSSSSLLLSSERSGGVRLRGERESNSSGNSSSGGGGGGGGGGGVQVVQVGCGGGVLVTKATRRGRAIKWIYYHDNTQGRRISGKQTFDRADQYAQAPSFLSSEQFIEISSHELVFPARVLLSHCCCISNGVGGIGAAAVALCVVCDDGWLYWLESKVGEGTLVGLLDDNLANSTTRYFNLGSCIPRHDKPTTLVVSPGDSKDSVGEGGREGGEVLVMVGRSGGNITVLSAREDLVSAEEDAAGLARPQVGATLELKEPLVKRLMSAGRDVTRLFGGSSENAPNSSFSCIGIHSIGKGTVVATHANGMLRIWLQHVLKGEVQVPAIEEDESIEYTSSDLHQVYSSGNETQQGLFLSLSFTNAKKGGTVGLLVMQILYDEQHNQFNLHKYGVVNFPSSYAAIQSMRAAPTSLGAAKDRDCGRGFTLCAVLLKSSGSSESDLKAIEVTEGSGSALSLELHHVKQKSDVLFDWISATAEVDFFPQVLGGAGKIESYVKGRLLDHNALDVEALVLALSEMGKTSSITTCRAMSADQLLGEIEVAIGNLEGPHGTAGTSPKSTQHWLHFLRLYVRFWKQRHSAVSLAHFWPTPGSEESPVVVIARSNGGIGILREADDVELFSCWHHHEDTNMVKFRKAMKAAEKLVGTWNKSFCTHFVCLGHFHPYEVTKRMAKDAVQAKLFQSNAKTLKDNIERVHLSQSLKERRFGLFELVSILQDIDSLENVVQTCLSLFAFSNKEESTGHDSKSLDKKARGGGLIDFSLGSILESLSFSRLDMFINFLITLQLYSLASQSEIYSVMKLVNDFSSVDLQTLKVVFQISSSKTDASSSLGAFTPNMGVRSRRIKFGNKTRKASSGPMTHVARPSLMRMMASSKLWQWNSNSSSGKLLSESRSFCNSFCLHNVEKKDAVHSVSVMILKVTLCLYALGQTRLIHRVLDGCELFISHTAEFRFMRGLGYCAQSTDKAHAAEEAFFSAINGVSHGSADLMMGIHQLKHELQGTSGSGRVQTSSMASLSKLDYYKTVTLLFRRVGNLEGAVKFTLAAIAQVKNSIQDSNKSSEVEEGKLWTTLFELFLDLKMWIEAYTTVIANPIGASSIAALHTLVITLLEADEISSLCELPLIGSRSAQWKTQDTHAGRVLFYLSEVENALLWHCDHISIDNGTNPYLPLYSFYTKLHKHRDAAGVMIRYARRLESGESSELTFRDMQSHYRSFLVAHNSLSLVDEKFRWIENPDFVKHNQTSEMMKDTDVERDINDKQIVTLGMLKCELLTSKARLFCCELSEDLSPQVVFFYRSVIDVCEVLAKKGKYKLIMDLIRVLPKERGQDRNTILNILAVELSKHCVSAGPKNQLESFDVVRMENGVSSKQLLESFSDHSHSWGLLKVFLKQFDDRFCNYRLRVIVADTLLTEKRNICLPQWLLDSFKNDLISRKSFAGYTDLLNVLIKHGLILDASKVAIEMLQTWKVQLTDPRERQKSGVMCIPYNILDALTSKLDSDHSLEEMKASLEIAMVNHFKSMQQESFMAA